MVPMGDVEKLVSEHNYRFLFPKNILTMVDLVEL